MDKHEKVREEIAIQICGEYGSDNWADLPEGERQDIYQLADQILSLDGIEIKSDDQSLPKPSNTIAPNYFEEVLEGKICVNAQQDMLKAGFIRVIPKPKRK